MRVELLMMLSSDQAVASGLSIGFAMDSRRSNPCVRHASAGIKKQQCGPFRHVRGEFKSPGLPLCPALESAGPEATLLVVLEWIE